MIIKNEISFDPAKPDSQKISKQSSLTWVPISSTTRMQFGYKLRNTKIDAEDSNIVSLSHLRDSEHSIFSFKEINNRPYELDDLVQTQVTYEMDMNHYLVTKEMYTLLDLIADIGAL